MQIILVSTTTLASGGARQAIYQARGLITAGHDVHFCAPAGNEMQKIAPDLQWHDLPKNLRQINRLLTSLMDANGPNVVHAFHNGGAKIAAYLGTLWRWQKRPVICAFHRGVTNRPGNPLPYLLPGIRVIVTNSQAAADTLPLLWRKKRCHVLHNAIPDERLATNRSVSDIRQELGIPADHFIIGDVAHNKPAKGASRLIEAFAKARPQLPPSTLVLVGVTESRWGHVARECGVAEYVRFTGRTEHVANYVQTFGLFVFPSFFVESQPNVIMEAMSLGVPVIGSRIGGVPELLPESCLFKPGDVAEMTTKIREVTNAPDLLQNMREYNLKQRYCFSQEYRTKKLLELYKAALHEDGLM